ncbi:MAG: peptide MFS transporter, partial [Planctomycetota bacterium]|nr:peptide MFS transporter [Planctomycetota bacterium]
MADAQTPSNDKTFLGHPLGLYTLFFTEMWERFSFYGMKALLLLYMVEYLVWDQQEASEVFKWYTSLVYFTPVFGGLIADYLLGARKSVAIGCVLITIGHLCLAFEPLPYFYAGLGFLILGVGFLKANISTQVGAMYHPGDPRRDAGFTIFYMGINLGAFLGPLVCGSLRFAYGWHYGFGAAGVGMFFGLIVYLLGQRWVIQVDQSVDAAGHELHADEPSGQDAGNPAGNAAKPAPHAQRDRVIALVICCLFAGIFFMCFEQAANVMMRWASDQTNLQVFHLEPTPASLEIDTAGTDAAAADSSPSDGGSWRDAEMPPDYTQSINPLFIILLGPLFGWLWIWLEKRRKQPSSPAKMALGLFLICMAFVVMMIASQAENKPSSAPLQVIPANVKLADYGATRLRFDETTHTLQMNGVLPELDRIRLLGESA